MISTGKKNLIAYYSRKGNNYMNGSIVDLPVGNTEAIAKIIRESTGGDLFKIETLNPYPLDYTETTHISLEEKKKNVRPELTEMVKEMEDYDVIYLGFPNWWGTMPMAVFTFLETYDFSGKTIIPFCTHEGSGMGRSERDIKKLCPQAKVLTGIAIRGTDVKTSEAMIKSWLP